jgi:DHA2 family multidrug resistance protein
MERVMHQDEASSLITGSKFLITFCAMLASLMAVLDISIVNVALNDIRASMGVGLDQIAWISTGYMMANVIIIPLTGWFQQRFGLRNYFLFSIVLFTFASLLCALSWSLTSLTLFRILQGLGGGAIIPTASTILMSRYPSDKQGMAQAFIGLGAITGPLLGPALGGYLINISSWHMIFLINIPFGFLVAFIAYKNIYTPNFISYQSPVDYIGILLLICGLGSLQYVLEEGSQNEWLKNGTILFLSIVAVICLITLLVQQIESKTPMIDFRIFSNKNYFLSSVINFFLGMALFSITFLFSLFCGNVLNYSPLDIGILFLKGCSIQVFTMPLIGKLIGKINSKILISIGITLVALSIGLASQLNHQASSYHLVLVLFIRSIGFSFVFIPLSVLAASQIDRKNLGNAVGLFNLTRELGGSICLAWMTTILINHLKEFDENLKLYLFVGRDVLQHQLNMMRGFFYGRVPNVEPVVNMYLQQRVTLQALVKSFGLSFGILTVLFFSINMLVFFLREPEKSEQTAVKIKDFH